jgi:serine/threonine protein kinase
VSGIAQGLAYLHAEGVVHGNLTTVKPLIPYHVVPDLGQKKILIDEAGFPVISGYGLANLNVSGHSSKNTITPPARFTAPEYFLNDQVLKNTVGDVYSFAMVALEVVTTLFR